MRNKRVALAFLLTMTAGSIAVASPASAAATVTPFSFTFTQPFETPIADCFGFDLVATGTNTFVVSGQSVRTSSGVFSIHASEDVSFQATFSNGMFASGANAVEHDHLVTNGSLTINGQITSRDARTIFNADGSVAFQEVFHVQSVVTFHDLNGDGVPQANEISASVDHFFFTCQ